jgi:hypothetical protein
MKVVKVKYFDIEKYEADWKQYYKYEETIHTNRLISPNDKGFFPYLKDVEVETEKFIKSLIEHTGSIISEIIVDNQLYTTSASVFDHIVEIDNDYLYHDNVGYFYISHIHTLRVLNDYYTRYKNYNTVDLNGLYGQIERELKLKTIIEVD